MEQVLEKADAMRAQRRLAESGRPVRIDGWFGPHSMAALMAHVAGRIGVTALQRELAEAAVTAFPRTGIDRPLRLAHALAQQAVETRGFAAMTENLDYSARVLRRTFGRHRISDADCQRLGRQSGELPLSVERQAALANILYGGTFGRRALGNVEPGDGWRFRGRGVKQITGRANYAAACAALGIDVLARPDLLAEPGTGMAAACHFWRARGCNELADADDLEALTRRVNGGRNGIVQRGAALLRARAILLGRT